MISNVESNSSRPHEREVSPAQGDATGLNHHCHKAGKTDSWAVDLALRVTEPTGLSCSEWETVRLVVICIKQQNMHSQGEDKNISFLHHNQ